jgi:hypothetical protein
MNGGVRYPSLFMFIVAVAVSGHDTALSQSCSTPAFAPEVRYTAGPEPRSTEAGDVDEDGDIDVVVLSFDGARVLLNDGQGGLVETAFYGVPPRPGGVVAGSNPLDIELADLDSDGHLDILVADSVGSAHGFPINRLWTLAGTGTGVFANHRSFDAGPDPRALGVGDFNADGVTDIAVTNFNTDQVGLLLGNGDGTVATAAFLVTDRLPTALAVADFDGDGVHDVAVVAVNVARGQVFYGDAAGSLTRSVYFDAGNNAESIAAGDIDLDGDIDLLAGRSGQLLSVVLNQGGVSFQPRREFAAGGSTKSALLVDIDRDGALDAVTADMANARVGVLLGDGLGNLSGPSFFAVGRQPISLTAADLNDDGQQDIAVANADFAGTGNRGLSILLNETCILNLPPAADAGANRIIEATAAFTHVTLTGSGSDPDGDPLSYTWHDAAGAVVSNSSSFTIALPLGTYEFALVVSDGQADASDVVTVDIRDTQAPQVTLSATPDVLWPPRRQLVPVHVNVIVLDAVDSDVTVTLVNVTASEADDGGEPDIQDATIGTDDRDVALRAERNAGGPGRVYELEYRATDDSGNTSTRTVQVSVPVSAPK